MVHIEGVGNPVYVFSDDVRYCITHSCKKFGNDIILETHNFGKVFCILLRIRIKLTVHRNAVRKTNKCCFLKSLELTYIQNSISEQSRHVNIDSEHHIFTL